MEISIIQDIIVAAAPAITAVIGIIVALICGVSKIKKQAEDTVNNVKQANRETLDELRNKNAEIIANVAQIAQNNDELKRENAELKKDLREVMAKLSHVHIQDK